MLTLLIIYIVLGLSMLFILEHIRKNDPDDNQPKDFFMIIAGSILWPLTLYIIIELCITNKDLFKDN